MTTRAHCCFCLVIISQAKSIDLFVFLISQGLYQKAEALYTMGDFEFDLVFYHRGHKQWPELQEFRLGIQKAQEAIDNSVGCKYWVKNIFVEDQQIEYLIVLITQFL